MTRLMDIRQHSSAYDVTGSIIRFEEGRKKQKPASTEAGFIIKCSLLFVCYKIPALLLKLRLLISCLKKFLQAVFMVNKIAYSTGICQKIVVPSRSRAQDTGTFRT